MKAWTEVPAAELVAGAHFSKVLGGDVLRASAVRIGGARVTVSISTGGAATFAATDLVWASLPGDFELRGGACL